MGGDKLVVANIGDSRAVLSRRGQAVAMSQDQKPTMFSEWERIKKAGGYIDDEGFLNGQLAVSSAIGDWHVDELRQNNDPSKCSTELIEEAINRHTTDNISCVCVCLSDAKPPELKQQKEEGQGMSRTLSSNAVLDLQKALLDVENKNMQQDFNNLGISE